MGKRPKRKTNYKIGDLVYLNDFGFLIELAGEDDTIRMGVIMSEAYVFVKTISESTTIDDAAYMQLEDWCYDVMLGDQLIRMMPEVYLEVPFVFRDDDTEEG